MELLKVFVGDGTTSGANLADMTVGDLYLVNASSGAKLTQAQAVALADNAPVQIVTKTSKGLKFSTPFKRTDLVKVNYVPGTGVTQKIMQAVMADISNSATTNPSVNKTFSLGVQIKEDLRMGTYNKNTEIIVSATTPSGIYQNATAGMEDITSTLAKGFAANPLTSSGSGSQLVLVERIVSGTVTGLAASGVTVAVVQGARDITITGTLTTTPAAGDVISISGKVYLVEKSVASGALRIVTLDTAYQGVTANALSANTGSVAVGLIATPTANSWGFTFTGVAQSRTNRYDQYRVVDFVLVYPKGFDAYGDITITPSQGLVYGQGTWAQVRDMEERSFTNSNPLINYREFPFEDFALNASLSATTVNFNLFTVVHTSENGYNYMQSNSKAFPQVSVAAVPTGTTDATAAANDVFASVLVGWYRKNTTGTNVDFA